MMTPDVTAPTSVEDKIVRALNVWATAEQARSVRAIIDLHVRELNRRVLDCAESMYAGTCIDADNDPSEHKSGYKAGEANMIKMLREKLGSGTP